MSPLRNDPDPIIASWDGVRSAPDYQQVPEPETAAMRALADAVLDRVWGRKDADGRWVVKPASPWRRFVTHALLPEDVTRYKEGRSPGQSSAADPSIQIAGPSGQISAFWLRSDHAAPSVPGDVTWSGAATIAPRELIALTTLSEEERADLIGFDGFTDKGAPVMNRYAIDPAVVNELADALCRAENTAFVNGAGSTTDPVTGVVSFSGITSQASTGPSYIDDALIAVTNLRILKRDPNVIFIPPSLEKIWRQAKDSTGGYIYGPDKPLVLADVPVVVNNGIAAGSSTFFLVGDFTWVKVLHRFMPSGKLVQVSRSGNYKFNTFETMYRVTERWDQNLTPGYGPGIIKVTGVNAP